MAAVTTTPLGQHLLDNGLITQDQWRVAMEEMAMTGERLGHVLIRSGFISRKQLFAVLSEVDPGALIGEETFDMDIPASLLLETKTMIVGDSGDEIYFATLHADPAVVIDKLEKHVGVDRRLTPVPIDLQKMHAYLADLERATRIEGDAGAGDINDIISRLIDNALQDNASDIHIETAEKVIHVRYRIDGIMHISRVLSLELRDKLFSRLKDLCGMDISEKRMPMDGSFSRQYRGRQVDFRAASLPCINGEKFTLRVLDKEKVIIDLEQLGLAKIGDWKDLCTAPNGIILVCGSTGSGKTTTLYSTIKLLDTLHKSVYMIEDPVEYKIPFVNQVQVNRKANLGFPEFIRTVLRHDPDVVIVGEIRDKETADISIRLADTGHLVFATLHTNDVPSSITRLKNLGVDLMELSFLLRGVLVQRLVRVLCRDCNGAGCKHCKQTGYRGRTLMSEFARFDNENDLQDILAHQKPYYTFAQDAYSKVSRLITDEREIRRAMGVNFAYEMEGED